MTLAEIGDRAGRDRLTVLGAFHPSPADNAPDGTGTLVLLGPDEPDFWPLFTASEEYRDGADDPLDRWSLRVITALAEEIDATPLFPFGGPPWQPFLSWAVRAGTAWRSPVTLLVHGKAGLWVSWRGALALPDVLDLPEPPAAPCPPCAKPCLTACPAGALTGAGYDIAACHAWLDTEPGQDCMTNGCAVRRACPAGADFGRRPDQSAFHMRSFNT
ncbi:ferredoxin [Rhodobacterales bacterium HKCCE2091]|nr:ferredoxin [Rhodobacterales bacterium HKCCE2091]